MAIDAAWSVERIDTLQSEWLPGAPQALRSNFLDGFNRIRNAALKYTLFEKSRSPFELSDLDDFITSYHIIRKLRSSSPSDPLHKVAHGLEIARKFSYKLLLQILGLVHTIEKALALKSELLLHKSTPFAIFNSVWRENQVSVASSRILESSGEWGDVVKVTSKCRQVDVRQLHDQALILAQDYMRRRFATVKLGLIIKELSIHGFRLFKRRLLGGK